MGGNRYGEPPAINMPEIRKVLAHIEGDLRRLEMRKWGISKGYVANAIPKLRARVTGVPVDDVAESDAEYLNMLQKFDDNGWAECGVRACFAGWQVLLSRPMDEYGQVINDYHELLHGVREAAQQGFGFTDDEAYAVFMPDGQKETPEEQLVLLKQTINKVLEKRGMTERV